MEDVLLIGISIAVLLYLFKVFLFSSKKGLIAFDLGGVFAKGQYLTERMEEREGMRDLVKKLKGNYKVALLSNQNDEAHVLFEKKFGLPKLFDGQIVSGRVGVKKPDAKIFRILLQNFNEKPEKTIFIDDAVENVDAAKKFGIGAIQFVSIPDLVKDLRNRGIKV